MFHIHDKGCAEHEDLSVGRFDIEESFVPTNIKKGKAFFHRDVTVIVNGKPRTEMGLHDRPADQ